MRLQVQWKHCRKTMRLHYTGNAVERLTMRLQYSGNAIERPRDYSTVETLSKDHETAVQWKHCRKTTRLQYSGNAVERPRDCGYSENAVERP